ncbi:helix-turn-helix transcriptional regulator [Metabacillus sp. KIGAM252]|uniref:Helix-turn-helix transcriptional regulator n=1 Tax=Metabacillus flavus TaxID=2823519 RepID=A0ABS5LHU0_9BACI|nr:helix-turn-helix transcriptional regulator [Metabacillus flavus]MBS2970303.1 helix-turn-helix transcriptional regulator [Metabacillus flavus]
MKRIGEIIKHYREQRRLSQQELALKMRMGVSAIEKYESGEQIPDTSSILNFSTVLDIPASELMEKHITASSGLDPELEQLIKEAGIKKAKLILRKTNELSEDDFLKVLQILFEKNIKKGE